VARGHHRQYQNRTLRLQVAAHGFASARCRGSGLLDRSLADTWFGTAA
jgi:hypothetical protein